MRKAILGAVWLASTYSVAFGQAPDAQPTFEVASVRPSTEQGLTPANSRRSGGPGTADPERITYVNVSLKTILLKAYGVQNYQLSGPDWLGSGGYDIVAKVPPGATEDQLNAMLRSLLAERFKLTLHHESKEMSVYELTVGRSGSKLQAADLNAPPPVERGPGSRPPTIGIPDKAGFPQIPPGRPLMLGSMTTGIMRLTGKMQSLSDLMSFVGNELGRPVVDKTGLTGEYDFTLAYSRDGLRLTGPPPGPNVTPGDPSGGPTLLKAVADQLGLKLEPAKDPIDILVIDHIDKAPTEN